MTFHMCVCIVLGVFILSANSYALSDSASSEQSSISEYLSESSIPSKSEINFCEKWIDSITAFDSACDRTLINSGLPFSFIYNGQHSDAFLGARKFDRKKSKDKTVITWIDSQSGLQLAWEILQIPKYPAVEWTLCFDNTGKSDTGLISNIQALRIKLHGSPSNIPYVIYGAHGGRSLVDDLMPFEVSLSSETVSNLKLGTTGANPDPWFYAFHSSNNHLPFFNIKMPQNRGVAIGIGWSGQWLADINASNSALTVKAGMKNTHFILEPGEKVRSPKILLVFWDGKPMHGQNMLRQVLYENYIPKLDKKPQKPLVSVNTCFTYHGNGGFLYCGEKELTPLVEPFAELGAESFVIDAGWWDCPDNYNINIGTYRPSLKRYPNGLLPLSANLAKHSMRMGLWMPVETVDPSTDFAKQNKEIVADNCWELGPWRLRMELPEAREWILSQIDDLVKHQGLGCYRQDFYTAYPPEAENRKGVMEMQHLDGLYTMLDEIRKRHPEMLMEGCAGGGRRIDLETLSKFHWHQKSDRWFDSVSDQCGLYGASLFLPGGVINVPVSATDDYGMWSSFAGQICLAWHPIDKAFPFDEAKKQIVLYKRIRHLLSGDFYPLTSCALDNKWLAYQFHRNDIDEGFAIVFKRKEDSSEKNGLRMFLKGLNPEYDYRLYFQRSGKEMMIHGNEIEDGIDVSVPDTPGAEMIIYNYEQN